VQTRHGNPFVRYLLCEAANAARRTKTIFRAKYESLVIRRGHKKTIIALAHKLVRTIYFVLVRREPYRDSTVDYEAASVAKNAPRWIRALKKYGYWLTENITSVRVTIGEVSREVRLSHMRFPNSGGWSFFVCPSCGRQARVLKLYERIGCWRCTGSEGRPLPYRVQLGDRSERIERLREKLNGGAVRLRPRPGRTLRQAPAA
jgi:hypothetical protein